MEEHENKEPVDPAISSKNSGPPLMTKKSDWKVKLL